MKTTKRITTNICYLFLSVGLAGALSVLAQQSSSPGSAQPSSPDASQSAQPAQPGTEPSGNLPPGLEKRDELPPGLQRDQLPPGLAKRTNTLDNATNTFGGLGSEANKSPTNAFGGTGTNFNSILGAGSSETNSLGVTNSPPLRP